MHARRADWLALLLEDVLKAVLFFHPAVHWLVGNVRLAREQTVDAAVVRRLGGREAYLESLVEVARFAAHARAVPAAPFLRESHLRERVDLLLKEVPMSRVRTVAHVGLTAAAIVLAVSWAASAVPLQSAKPAAPAAKIAIADKVTAPGEPKLVHQVKPAYPEDAKKEGVEGLFVIDVVIGKDGAIKEAHVAASAPTARATEGAGAEEGHSGRDRGRQATRRGGPRPPSSSGSTRRSSRSGKPVEFKATVTVNFKLS